jgi:hypothetical protein
VAAIGAGVTAIGLAIAITGILPGQTDGIADRAALLVALGGFNGVLGLLWAQGSRDPGRGLVALGGLMLLLAPFAFERPVFWVMALEIVLGLLLLAASAFVGRMPVDNT